MMLKAKLTKNQWRRVSEILNGTGLLTAGSVVIPHLSGEFNATFAIMGVVISIFFWYGSIATARKY